jgi:hypothetical protein
VGPPPPPTSQNTHPTTQQSQSQILPSSSVGAQLPGTAALTTNQRSGTQSAGTAAASSTQAPPPPILLGTQVVSQDSLSDFIIGSQTLVPGSAITVGGQQVSLASSGNALIVNAASQTQTPSAPPAVVVIGGSTITANSASAFVIGSQTLTPGGAITASGQLITLPLSDPPQTSSPTPTSMPVVAIGSSTFTENSLSDFVIGTQTLTPGGAINVDGQMVSLSPTGNAVIVNGAAPTTFVTAAPESQITSLVIAGQTLIVGGEVTVGGDILSLAPSGTGIIIIGTVTIGGGEITATATAKAKKKSAGERVGGSYVLIVLQLSFIVVVFWLN